MAANLIDDGLKADPRDQDLQFLQARRLMSAGAADQALKVLQNLERPTGEALGLKAGLLARGGQYAPAAQAYEQALRTRPDNATWWLGLGVAWQPKGRGPRPKTHSSGLSPGAVEPRRASLAGTTIVMREERS